MMGCRYLMVVLFGVFMLLLLSLIHSWTIESELQKKIGEISLQLEKCSDENSACFKRSVNLGDERNEYKKTLEEVRIAKKSLDETYQKCEFKLLDSKTQLNKSQVALHICETELQSLKNLEVSMTATMQTLRLEVSTLTANIAESKKTIGDLEKEISLMKTETKKLSHEPKVTPVVELPKSQALNVNQPLQEPNLDNNDAKEDVDEMNNPPNDGNDFDQNIAEDI